MNSRKCQTTSNEEKYDRRLSRFVNMQEKFALERLAAAQDKQRLQRALNDSKKKIENLEMQLDHARQMIDFTNKKRIKAEKNKKKLKKMLFSGANGYAMDCRFPIEAKENFELKKKKSCKKRKGKDKNVNTTVSLLPDLSIVHSKHDLLDLYSSDESEKSVLPLTEKNGVRLPPKLNETCRKFRKHSFSSRMFFTAVDCDSCFRKIQFGLHGLKCRNCDASLHVGCKESFEITCAPPSEESTLI